ncbi:MAG: hypothetical protein ACI8PZ_002165 [Myxococcota bacterium]|jgi:hypothetical protein
MSNTDRNRTNIKAVIHNICTGKLLEGFEQYYADDCVMSENDDPTQTREGKEANRQYETYFVQNAEFHGVEVGPVIADGDTTAYQMAMDFTMGGQRMQRSQWAVQTWNADGQISKEVFHYKG